jgi:cytidylate kinase
MKHVLTLEQFMNEGFNDPGILKAFFMAGGPGSGKSYVASELFGFPKGGSSSVSYATGLKVINSDDAFEKMAKDAGFDLSNIANIPKDPEKWEELMKIRDRAKELTKTREKNYLSGRLGLVIDGTGKNFDKIEKKRALLQDGLGYDTYMVFVNTSLEVALERNRMRTRKLPDAMVTEMWNEVQDNIGKFQKLFGNRNMFIIDNSSYDNDETLRQIEKIVLKEVKKPIKNHTGKIWLRMNDPKNRDKNKPA